MIAEREAGLGVEAAGGIPGPITRDPTGAAEFIDAAGGHWDVKGFRSDFPPKQGGFTVDQARQKIQREINAGHGVILDTRGLSPEHRKALEKLVADQGWANRMRWFP